MNPDFQLKLLLDTVCKYYDVDINQVKGQDRKRKFVVARHVFVYLARQKTGCSLQKITELINRDHSSGTHAVKTTINDCAFIPNRSKEIREISEIFENNKYYKIEVLEIDLLKLTINHTKSFINS